MTWKTGSPRLQDNDPGRQSSPLRPRAHVRTTGKPVKRCKKKGGLLGAPPHGSIPTEQTIMHPTPLSTLPFIQPGLEPKVARSSRSKSQDRVKKATRFANTRGGTGGAKEDGTRFRRLEEPFYQDQIFSHGLRSTVERHGWPSFASQTQQACAHRNTERQFSELC